MTDLLDTLSDRANRAHPDPDVDSIVDGALVRGRRLAHRRRLATVGASGAVLVAAVAIVAALVTSAHTGSRATPAATVPRPAPSATGGTDETTGPTTGAAPVRLVPARATPKEAPVSLGLLPERWTPTGSNEAVAVWSRPDDPDAASTAYLVGKLYVAVTSSNGEKLRTKDFPLRVAGHPATYRADTTSQLVSLYVKSSVTVDIDIPAEAGLTRAQALELAGSVTIRRTDSQVQG